MKISIVGCTGRMGCTIINETLKSSFFSLSGGYGKYQNTLSGIDLGEIANGKKINIFTSDSLEKVIDSCDTVIDFSAPQLSLKAAKIASSKSKIFVSGTTGFTDSEFTQLKSLANNSPFIWASNMSIGVNLLNMLIEKSCQILDDSFDTEIIEMHHKHKKDAPSGTAISLGKSIASAKNLDFNEVSTLSREGITSERKTNEIGFATLRGGSVIGDHTVIFAGENEQIELTHKAVNRNIFANGALRTAKWAKDQAPGFYSIKDTLQSF